MTTKLDTKERVFEDFGMLGELSDREQTEIFETMHGMEATARIMGGSKAWKWTTHHVGFIPVSAVDEMLELTPASQIEADTTLDRIIVRLDRLRIFDYPGGGVHQVLVTFKALHWLKDNMEAALAFNQTYRAREDEVAGVAGFPIFAGLAVDKAMGSAFKFATINVRNERDARALRFLEGETFKNGLKLLDTVQPALKPLSETAIGLATWFLERNNDRPVQDFSLGLDFNTGSSMGARLAEGNYVAIQAPTDFSLSDWRLQRSTGKIVRADDSEEVIPFNYISFRVNRFLAE